MHPHPFFTTCTPPARTLPPVSQFHFRIIHIRGEMMAALHWSNVSHRNFHPNTEYPKSRTTVMDDILFRPSLVNHGAVMPHLIRSKRCEGQVIIGLRPKMRAPHLLRPYLNPHKSLTGAQYLLLAQPTRHMPHPLQKWLNIGQTDARTVRCNPNLLISLISNIAVDRRW